MKKVSVILPVYDEKQSLEKVLSDIYEVLKDSDHEIIVVNDGSEDDYAHICARFNARQVRHPYNMGNGASIKTGLRQARGQYIVMMDADGQHDPHDIPRLLQMLEIYDMVVGARSKHSQTMLHRSLANKFYNAAAGYLAGHRIYDLTSGFRAIRAEVARRFIYLLPNGFSYPSTITVALFRAGYSVKYIPVITASRKGKSKIRIITDGMKFLFILSRIGALFSPLKIFLPVSACSFLIGMGHAFYKIVLLDERYTGFSILFITTAVIVFMMGLVAEQIALLRFERSEIS